MYSEVSRKHVVWIVQTVSNGKFKFYIELGEQGH